MGNIQFNKGNYTDLSSAVRTKLQGIAAKDGVAGNISGRDMALASKAEIQGLVDELKKDGYSVNEQKLMEIIFDLTQQSKADITNKGVKSYAFDGTDDAISVSFNPLEEDESAADLKKEHRAAQKVFVNKGNLVDNAPELEIWGFKMKDSEVDYNISSDTLTSNKGIGKMMKARKELVEKYGFNPKNPFDFNAVKAMKDKLSNAQTPKFIETYMTAFFEHPGGAGWSEAAKNLEEDHNVKGLFFGNPPPLQQLPDGRCLIDCQGYAALSELMFDTLIPGRDQPRVFMLPVRYPGHEMGIMRVGDDAYMVDNNNVNPLPLTDSELKYFEKVIQMKSGLKDHMDWDIDLDDMKLSRSDFPTLYDYLEKHHKSLNDDGKSFELDEDDALKDG